MVKDVITVKAPRSMIRKMLRLLRKVDPRIICTPSSLMPPVTPLPFNSAIDSTILRFMCSFSNLSGPVCRCFRCLISTIRRGRGVFLVNTLFRSICLQCSVPYLTIFLIMRFILANPTSVARLMERFKPVDKRVSFYNSMCITDFFIVIFLYCEICIFFPCY